MNEVRDEPKKKVVPDKIRDNLMKAEFTVMTRDGDLVKAFLSGRLKEFPRLCFKRNGYAYSFEVSWQTALHCWKNSLMIRE